MIGDHPDADENWDTESTAVDSSYSDSLFSTASITSSIFDYEKEHGRTYHAFHAGKYVLPNDGDEQQRMDIHYHALRLSIEDKLFHAPIKPTSILDVGTGTGIWSMDAADEYPAAVVTGIDLSPIQPTFVPPNLSFEIVDADEEWVYEAGRFDLVHTRFMNGFSLKSWPHFYGEAFRTLKPGGWVENQEFDLILSSDDDSIPDDSQMVRWGRLWNEGAQKAGITGRCDIQLMRQQMEDAGFVNIEIKKYQMPIGLWPKDETLKSAGWYGLVALLEGLDGLSTRIFTKYLDWQLDELEVFLALVRSELKRKSIHAYWPTFVGECLVHLLHC